jgi:hypothetical protein
MLSDRMGNQGCPRRFISMECGVREESCGGKLDYDDQRKQIVEAAKKRQQYLWQVTEPHQEFAIRPDSCEFWSVFSCDVHNVKNREVTRVVLDFNELSCVHFSKPAGGKSRGPTPRNTK